MFALIRVWLSSTLLALLYVLVSYAAVAAVPAMAAEILAQPLDIDELVNAVVSRNPALSSQRLRAAARQELVAPAGALDDPFISYMVAPSSIGDSIPSNFGNALGIRQNFQLSQTIPWPGKRELRSEKMAADADVAEHGIVVTRLDLITRTRLLWAQWWYVNAAMNSNLEHQRLSAELRSIAETQYANGMGLQQDVLSVETHAVRLRHQHIVLEQEQRRLQAQLNYLLDQSPSTVLQSPDDRLEFPGLPEQPELIRWMLDTHPALLELKSQANVALLNQRLVEKDDYPDLQFSLGYNEMWDESAMRLQAGVSLNIPLDFGKRSGRKSAAQFEYHSAQMAIQDKRSELLSELEIQISSFDEADHGSHLIAIELLPASEQIVNAALASYESGSGNFYALIDAYQQLLDMQLLLANSRAEQFFAAAEINRLTGGQLWPPGATQ